MNKIPTMCLGALLLALGVASAPIDQTPMSDVLVCSGNEPFWNLRLDGAEARFLALGAAEGEATLAGGSRSLDFAGVLVWRGDGGASRPGDLVAFVQRQSCMDTMADEDEGGGRWPYSVVISLADRTVLLGCCRQPEQTDGTGKTPPGEIDSQIWRIDHMAATGSGPPASVLD